MLFSFLDKEGFFPRLRGLCLACKNDKKTLSEIAAGLQKANEHFGEIFREFDERELSDERFDNPKQFSKALKEWENKILDWRSNFFLTLFFMEKYCLGRRED